ncbi:MAG: RNA polymerase sigma factor [Patescibacteria group bacterium]
MSTLSDTKGFTAFFMAYRPKLIGLLMRTLNGCREDADDVLQDVWIKGARAWPPRDAAYARAWLGKIAINEAVTWQRRAKRRPKTVSADRGGNALGMTSHDVPADDLVAYEELCAAIAALEGRYPRQIAALRLVHLEGFTYLEASRALGIAEGTVKSMVHHITERLRVSLTPPKAA